MTDSDQQAPDQQQTQQAQHAGGDARPSARDVPVGEFIEYLGLEVTEISGSRLVGTWRAGPHLHQPWGIVHGGVHCSVVETLASMGGQVWLEEQGHEGAHVVGVNNSTDFLRAVTEGPLTSVATPVHQGRSQQLWVVETRDEADRLVSRGQVRLQNLQPRG